MTVFGQDPTGSAPANTSVALAPMRVHSHVTPWGFIFALPLGLTFAYLGALTLDTQIVPVEVPFFGSLPFWLFSALLLAFAVLLFLIGIAELANYVKPSVEVVLDQGGVTTWGVLGEQRNAWADIVGLEFSDDQIALRARSRQRGGNREVRLQFNRLEAAPADILAYIRANRPDLELIRRPG